MSSQPQNIVQISHVILHVGKPNAEDSQIPEDSRYFWKHSHQYAFLYLPEEDMGPMCINVSISSIKNLPVVREQTFSTGGQEPKM